MNLMMIKYCLTVPTGYFIYDFFDMVTNQTLSQSWELLFHHLVVGLSRITVTVGNELLSKISYFTLTGEC